MRFTKKQLVKFNGSNHEVKNGKQNNLINRWKKLENENKYDELVNSGMFFDIFPELTGEGYEKDKNIVFPKSKLQKAKEFQLKKVYLFDREKYSDSGYGDFDKWKYKSVEAYDINSVDKKIKLLEDALKEKKRYI